MSYGSVHSWFGLSYSAYLVLPRSLMEGMPEDWQQAMVDLLERMRETYDEDALISTYTVNARKGRKFVSDPFRHYRHPGPLPYRVSPPVTPKDGEG